MHWGGPIGTAFVFCFPASNARLQIRGLIQIYHCKVHTGIGCLGGTLDEWPAVSDWQMWSRMSYGGPTRGLRIAFLRGSCAEGIQHIEEHLAQLLQMVSDNAVHYLLLQGLSRVPACTTWAVTGVMEA